MLFTFIRSFVQKWRGRPHVDQAGFGQSWLDDISFRLRFLRARGRPVMWRAPSDEERRVIDHHVILSRFGDTTLLVADVDAQRWIVRERDWWGWPDPPRYVFFALHQGAIHAAADFDGWPSCWHPHPADPSSGETDRPSPPQL